ncbi:kinase-like domain-containing protein [Rhizophagus clarus]|uniref:Kinase-like domain-containing protein n=1 Tax=Rhizophagus clarus TaxID=94130 RepID=A0A8H3QYQ7_9GLOM|nr:kinase-like domain-containing protein [Rhizophagus clarus]
MEKLMNYKYQPDFLTSVNTPLIQHIQNSKLKRKLYIKCNECSRERKSFDESHQICYVCYKITTMLKSSGNKVINDFIRYTQINRDDPGGELEFITYDRFKNIEFIAEGGFSKIYKATWVGGPIDWYFFKCGTGDNHIVRKNNCTVALKKLHDSKNITSMELNELKMFYQIYSDKDIYKGYINEYFGITQDPITKDMIIIMPYYNSGDLMNYIRNDFHNISWETKLDKLRNIICGLVDIHKLGIIHRDLHGGNIFFDKYKKSYIGDLGISKSAINNNEIYGIIPYIAPEIFQGQKYTTDADIYSFGMIMWEFMTGRRSFWDEIHDIELIIKICDGLRPPIVANAPKGYIELMVECWNSDPKKRPTAAVSSDIGPVTINNPGAIYKSRPLSCMIQSANSLRNSRSQLETGPFYYYPKNNVAPLGKRRFDDDLSEDSNNNDQDIKRSKLFENDDNFDYFMEEIELDINANFNKSQNNENNAVVVNLENILSHDHQVLFSSLQLFNCGFSDINLWFLWFPYTHNNK